MRWESNPVLMEVTNVHIQLPHYGMPSGSGIVRIGAPHRGEIWPDGDAPWNQPGSIGSNLWYDARAGYGTGRASCQQLRLLVGVLLRSLGATVPIIVFFPAGFR